MARNTSTGGVLEAMIVPALLFGGYEVSKQVKIGCRPGGRTHNVDEAFIRLANSGSL